MICEKCGNPNNFLVFRGEVIYITDGSQMHSESTQLRVMCNECFSCDVAMEEKDKYLQEVAA